MTLMETPPDREKRFARVLGFVLGFVVAGTILYVLIGMYVLSKYW
jgi:hypothetical protein